MCSVFTYKKRAGRAGIYLKAIVTCAIDYLANVDNFVRNVDNFVRNVDNFVRFC